MPLELRDSSATLSGVLTVEEVEPLVGWLRTTSHPVVDLHECTHLHTGALQALLHFQVTVTVAPRDPFLATHVLPLLTRGAAPTTDETAAG